MTRKIALAVLAGALGVTGATSAAPGPDDQEPTASTEVEGATESTSDEDEDAEIALVIGEPSADAFTDTVGTADGPEDGVQRSTDGCPEGESFPIHGEFVSSREERPRNEAAQSNCGKPAHAANGGEGSGPEAGSEKVEPRDDGDGGGPPAHARGKGEGKGRGDDGGS